MSATTEKTLRIGEVADLTGTTPRTIRYYEEIGLLPGEAGRLQGQHRVYTEADVDRINEIRRLRDLLGLSLEQLKAVLEAETARAELRRAYRETEDPGAQHRILTESLGHISTQLELVRNRRLELEQLDAELTEKRKAVKRRLKELEQA
jgi:MerR family transcriptional regulator, repressor of the yfmOP operon